MASGTDIESFMEGPLVTWLKSCLESPKCIMNYEDLIDGMVIHEVMLQINPEPEHDGVMPSMGNPATRIRNLDIILKNMKAVYEEELCQTLLMVPDCVEIGRHHESKAGLENMQLFLLLLLGCAVQCPNKERFIYHIKQLSEDTQHDIVDCIKQVTDSQRVVLSPDTSEENFPADLMMNHVRRLIKERDAYLQQWLNASVQERGDTSASSNNSTVLQNDSPRRQTSQMIGSDSHHLAVELADWKSRLRKQRQELEEKSEALAESKEEAEHHKLVVAKLRNEIQDLMQEARSAKLYRDELDAIRERAERVDKLESEVQRYREKLSDIDFYKSRVEELREDNRVLMETREMLEEQLQSSRKRSEHVLDLENELIKCKKQINEMGLDQEAIQERLQEAFEENKRLQILAKNTIADNALDNNVLEETMPEGSNDNSLSEQLSSNAQARALRLELENRRLQSAMDNLKESSFLENSNKILDLEKEKKKLSMKVEQLQENINRMQQQNSELEKLVKDALQDNIKLQESRESFRCRTEKLDQELQVELSRRGNAEHLAENLSKEKQWLQNSYDSLQRKAEELERAVESASQLADRNRLELQRIPELQRHIAEAESKCQMLERERQVSLREISKLKEVLETRDVTLDKRANEIECLVKEATKLNKDLEEAKTLIIRLQEVEREGQDVASKAALDREALTALQGDLVAEKMCVRQIKGSLERIGLTLEQLQDPDNVLDNILTSAEVQRAASEMLGKIKEDVCNTHKSENIVIEQTRQDLVEQGVVCQCEDLRSEVASLQSVAESAHSDNARLQVHVATLQSRVSALSAQHTALQVANTQLVAEKDELLKQKSEQQQAHEQLLLDQVTLQSLHEQLTGDYEALVNERQTHLTVQRDLRSELRLLRERCALLDQQTQSEKDSLKEASRSLGNLRAEHSKLKDDFRNLFTASEKQRMDFRGIQDEHKLLRAENAELRIRQTQLQGELASQLDHINSVELELSKLRNKCEMLLQMNTGLEEDRRSLMEHVTQLLSQYQELLNHSLEDKEHYHLEEKMYTDKLNNLHRQKEKLEEKIMEHYRRMDSCSTKKRSFGASLVKKVKKASSDLINKSRRSWHEDARSVEIQPAVSLHGSESGGNDSDTSLEDIHAQPMQGGGFARSSLSLGSAGTRRTVYYTEEETNEEEQTKDGEHEDEEEEEKSNLDAIVTSTPAEPRLLVYNRISTVIGETPGTSQWNAGSPTLPIRSQSRQDDNNSKRGGTLPSTPSNKSNKARENSIWYEYGCV
ncbi:girdin [Frankliniella occidentalis]|uniref:Girdin n=1 Tax=Frankliniella occidentalis TaxID=133901 RepID=A0A6J1S862_FRAOC|nr:girdin [Frankliniella occidentalis]XP_026276833.1 girdin [Frankliniella occidentalis]XP_026276835.1 girdin [Frankliniella occidentalis]XP_052120752.1 girdin [Frankliniella occidentalis]